MASLLLTVSAVNSMWCLSNIQKGYFNWLVYSGVQHFTYFENVVTMLYVISIDNSNLIVVFLLVLTYSSLKGQDLILVRGMKAPVALIFPFH